MPNDVAYKNITISDGSNRINFAASNLIIMFYIYKGQNFLSHLHAITLTTPRQRPLFDSAQRPLMIRALSGAERPVKNLLSQGFRPPGSKINQGFCPDQLINNGPILLFTSLTLWFTGINTPPNSALKFKPAKYPGDYKNALYATLRTWAL